MAGTDPPGTLLAGPELTLRYRPRQLGESATRDIRPMEKRLLARGLSHPSCAQNWPIGRRAPVANALHAWLARRLLGAA